MYYSKPVLDAKNYINKNLTTDLSLEIIADYVHISPYYFHRLFLLSEGEAPMEYVRRRRLRAAACDLLSTDILIIEVAAEYRFESQDGFSRSFKRYYGVTPRDYRKMNALNRKFDDREKSKEACKIMYEANIYEKLMCSNSDKQEALSTFDKILELSQKARCSGLLSLEPEIDTVQPEIFKKSLQLLIDGIESGYIKEILMNYTLCEGYKGKELLIRLLIIEGVLAIQQGVQTAILREKLSSFFGEDYIGEIQKHCGMDSKAQSEKIDAFLNKNQNKSVIYKETSLLEEPLGRMDSRSLQRLLREINVLTLAIALTGASHTIQSKVIKNISKKFAIVLIDEINAMKAPIISEISDCQKQILETMHHLQKQGDITI